MNRLIIIGASGHGKVVADIAIKLGYMDIVFLDDDLDRKECNGYKVVGTVADYSKYDCDFCVAIGDISIRSSIIKNLISCGKSLPVLVHPNTVIADDVVIGRGSVIVAGAIINPNAKIGEGCIINTAATVDHDSIIGDYCHVSVGVHVAGTVKVGNYTWIGTGAIVNNNLYICDNCMVGAGAVVISDLLESGTYVGVPAKRI
ncbi:MAG: acetyltransferase [Saccharofermentans sp.]|nr:acetyltransferase [Saccharofermentans sp.]